jgi:hypothetical protein
MRKVLVRKIWKAAGPSSPSQEAPIASQVWITFFIIDLLFMYILLDYTPFFLKPIVVDISSGEEPPHQIDSASEVPEDVEVPVNALIALRDPDPTALEGPLALIDAPVIPQGLQELIVAASVVNSSSERPVVASTTANLPSEGTRLLELTAASSAVAPPSER